MHREKVKEKVKENEDFFDYKNINLKMPQICILAKRLVLAICVKCLCFYGICHTEKVIGGVLEKEK